MKLKYPGMSPYIFAADNPVLFIDIGGEEYSLFINHDTKTITIKATYMAVNENTKGAMENALNYWNSQSDKFQYVIGEGDSRVAYDIKIELSVATDLEVASGDWYIENKGPLNKMEILTSAEYPYTGSEGINQAERIYVIDEANNRNPDIILHETGHNLGIRHKAGFRLMSEDANRRMVWASDVDDILGQAGIGPNSILQSGSGENNSEQLGKPIGPDFKREAGTDFFETGESPENFENGKVEPK